METGFSKFFRSSVRDAEIILRAGQRIISEINILVENSQGSSQIPKSNPQLLNAEIKKKIARHENIKKSLKAPMVIFGDFNLHHPVWGSDHISRYSNEFVDWIIDSNLVLLNTTVPTYRSSAGAASLIDLTVCSSSMSGYCNSYVLDCSFESDHSPIITELSLLNSNKRTLKKINHYNSIFAAETLAICQALDDLVESNVNLLVLS
ncbi:RNA-directed DNA polymerase from mobile element jockey [Trichonephila clavipes]|nr:RNA-directed DNA polymerase from mobile element jockey [Trichonephila clavipes]